MTLWRLVGKEIVHRKLNFSMGLLSVAVAVGCLVGALALLKAHDQITQQILDSKEEQTKKELASLEDKIRKAMLELGFNIQIWPKELSNERLFRNDFSAFMPESYVHTLANSPIVTVQHLQPSLFQKVVWPETKRTVLLVGTRTEVPIVHRIPKKPLEDAIPRGTMELGFDLHQDLNFKEGQTIKFFGKNFRLSKCKLEGDLRDNITIWINLGDAQEILDKKGLINSIRAIECRCAWANLDKVRQEVGKILPQTRVIEEASRARARKEARDQAAITAKKAMEIEKKERGKLRDQQEEFFSVLVPLILLASALWIGILSFLNVRERKQEIGIFRALGLQGWQIMTVFLSKAFFIGLVGGGIGYFAGILCGAYLGDFSQIKETVVGLRQGFFVLQHLLLALIFAPILAIVASWLPAILAAKQDPAIVLREE